MKEDYYFLAYLSPKLDLQKPIEPFLINIIAYQWDDPELNHWTEEFLRISYCIDTKSYIDGIRTQIKYYIYVQLDMYSVFEVNISFNRTVSHACNIFTNTYQLRSNLRILFIYENLSEFLYYAIYSRRSTIYCSIHVYSSNWLKDILVRLIRKKIIFMVWAATA